MDPIREMYGRWAAGDMGQDDQWGDVTAEPRGVDYREVSADGVPAMWLEPHGAAEAYAGGRRRDREARHVGTAEAGALTEAFERERRGLLAHAYRMLGAFHDAEDVVQETYLRALKGWQAFESRSSVRTWLYRIATNTALTAIEGRGRRALPSGLGPPSDDPSAPLEPAGLDGLEPLPTDPADLVTTKETVRLAFVAGLQYLPARQRAVLLLREVLGFSGAETGAILGLTVPAVTEDGITAVTLFGDPALVDAFAAVSSGGEC